MPENARVTIFPLTANLSPRRVNARLSHTAARMDRGPHKLGPSAIRRGTTDPGARSGVVDLIAARILRGDRMSTKSSTPLPALPCPLCHTPMAVRPTPPGGVPTVTTLADCLRQCVSCGVAYSNARSNPTLLHRDPIANVPAQVRIGAREALAVALNERNRPNKLSKFGYSTSEDAVTWTVFAYLHGQHRTALAGLYERAFGIQATAPPAMLLWGVPVPAGQAETALAANLERVLDGLGEARNSRSEPDVVLDFGPAGVVFIEVKYRSGNSGTSADSKFDRYVDDSAAFTDPAGATSSGLYELARNWRIAHDLAGGRPFTVVNLAKSRTLASTKGLAAFHSGLATSSTQRFLPVSWGDFLAAARQTTGAFPAWLDDYCAERRLR